MRTVSRAQTRRGKSAIEVGQPGGGQGHDIFDADTVDVDCSQCYGVIVQCRQTLFSPGQPCQRSCQAQQPPRRRIVVLRGPDHAERQHLIRKFPVGNPWKLGHGCCFARQSEAATESDQR